MKRILILGAGMLGWYLHEFSKISGHDLHFASRSPRNWENIHQVDILDRGRLKEVVKTVGPDVVINAAVFGNINGCEKDPDQAFRTNHEGQRNVISVCNELGVKVVYISTNSVFCGKKGNYREEYVPHPGTVYGRSKLAGEKVTREEAKEWAIFRITALFGNYPHQMDFVQQIVHELSHGRDFKCWDQVIIPTYGPFVAQTIMELVESEVGGIWHVAGKDCLPRFDIGRKIRESLIRLRKEQIEAKGENQWGGREIGTIEQIPTPEGLPQNRTFSVEKLEQEFPGTEFPDFGEIIEQMIGRRFSRL